VFQACNDLANGLITQKQFDKTWTTLSFMTSEDTTLQIGEIIEPTAATWIFTAKWFEPLSLVGI